MSEILKAMAISGSILLPVVVLVIVVSIFAVRRGEAAMGGHDPGLPSGSSSGAAAAAAGKAAPVQTRDATVLEILVLGVVLFTLTMGLLIGISVIQHLN